MTYVWNKKKEKSVGGMKVIFSSELFIHTKRRETIRLQTFKQVPISIRAGHIIVEDNRLPN